jgi:lactoylglutathione lyase
MNLNHINLGVTDVPATVAMFEKYFGLRRAAGMPITPRMAFLNDDSGALLSLFKVDDVIYPRTFHIGFIQKSVEDVRRVHAELTAGGFVAETPREEHGRLTFYFTAPGGFVIEVDAFFKDSVEECHQSPDKGDTHQFSPRIKGTLINSVQG